MSFSRRQALAATAMGMIGYFSTRSALAQSDLSPDSDSHFDGLLWWL
jgi:hypothetical protein